MSILFLFLVISIGLNLLMFIPAYWFKTDKLTDVSYALTFALLAWLSVVLVGATWLSVVVAGMVTVWAIRLGTYLLIRVHRLGRDDRFDVMRESFFKFAGFWLLQGFTVWVVMLPVVLFIGNRPVGYSVLSLFGIVVWLTGLLIEAVADWQLFRFITDPVNAGKWIDRGLWHYSRHPNYFGEITHWAGIYLFVVGGLIGGQVLIGLIGPLYIASLILFVSGVPILEKKADARWGGDEAYRRYKERTSLLVPLPR